MGADEEVRQRQRPLATPSPIELKCRRRKRRTWPRKATALHFVHIEQLVKQLNIRPWYKQFGIDDQIDVQRRLFATPLKFLNRPFVPWACHIDAVDPDVTID